MNDIPAFVCWIICPCQGRLLVKMMTDRSKDAAAVIAREAALSALSDDKQHQLLAARGLLACGLLVHCLQSRHSVNHGVNRCAAGRQIVAQQPMHSCLQRPALS